MDNLVEVENLVKYFPVKTGVFKRVSGWVKAVDGVSFNIKKRETLGLVGESGCGKTTTGRCIIRLIEPTSGKIMYNGEDLLTTTTERLLKLRKEMQIIFQDPFASLNPRMNVGRIIGEGLVIQKKYSKSEIQDRVIDLLKKVGLEVDHIKRYPHEFSGGQRQRIGIARALAVNAKFIVCDEPVSALDVSIQSQILNLLDELQDEFGLTYLFIAHDLSVVEHVSDRVAVMYLGKIVEIAYRDELYENPLHPYTKALLSAVPIPDPRVKTKRIILKGDVPSPVNVPPGCNFHTRCMYRKDICSKEIPTLKDMGNEHIVACHYAGKLKS
ncbi:MAG: dipeptide ABC transporter ATP-binding protein [Actinomycetia bacterium]|nr:dipeptide ABC transporter ATP-binding protein [Actinomycetes bacterium]